MEYLTYDQQVGSGSLANWHKLSHVRPFFLKLQSGAWRAAHEPGQALVGDLGGYLGLFLGCSLYSLLADLPTWLRWGDRKYPLARS